MPNITLPDGSVRSFEQPVTIAQVAASIGTGLARQRDQQRLRSAHAELEKRVEERTRELAEVNEKLLGQIGERLRARPAIAMRLNLFAGLAFIGLGIQPPQSEWGSMTAEGAQYIVTGEWWLFLFPGLAIVVMVLAFNLVGDGMQDAHRGFTAVHDCQAADLARHGLLGA